MYFWALVSDHARLGFYRLNKILIQAKNLIRLIEDERIEQQN